MASSLPIPPTRFPGFIKGVEVDGDPNASPEAGVMSSGPYQTDGSCTFESGFMVEWLARNVLYLGP